MKEKQKGIERKREMREHSTKNYLDDVVGCQNQWHVEVVRLIDAPGSLQNTDLGTSSPPTRTRDKELSTIAKYMKDASKRFFDIAGSHPNALLRSVVDYESPHRHHFIRRSRNVLNDPPEALTAAVNSLMKVNDTRD
ncbi:hypothetical protein EVAR_81353_1 [Eumeta japonica]|uniref:Uncharacterized protein n=1 Tax=Eumeta variegata TaxID=151549 RepID=A0A4C1X8R7_EUMVA|nr:hypothetical protein EVAR_81353_1 [Eumeta japonica]